jgi:hypothetical protein
MRNLSLAATLLFTSGCAGITPPVTAGAPHVLQVAENSNPDVLWIVRPVQPQSLTLGGGTQLFGLFACYRSPTPAAPKCFLAETSWKPEDLQWPGAYMLTRTGELKKIKIESN